MVALPDDHSLAGEHITNALQRFLRIALLNMANQGVNDSHPKNDKHIHPVSHYQLQQRRRQKDVNENIVEMGQKAQPAGFTRFLR